MKLQQASAGRLGVSEEFAPAFEPQDRNATGLIDSLRELDRCLEALSPEQVAMLLDRPMHSLPVRRAQEQLRSVELIFGTRRHRCNGVIRPDRPAIAVRTAFEHTPRHKPADFAALAKARTTLRKVREDQHACGLLERPLIGRSERVSYLCAVTLNSGSSASDSSRCTLAPMKRRLAIYDQNPGHLGQSSGTVL